MALHRIASDHGAAPDRARTTIAPATYASDLARRALPKRRMPDEGVSPDSALALVRDELLLDGHSRQNLATFCTTWVSSEVRQLMQVCWKKFAKYFDVELREIPLEPDAMGMRPEQVAAYCDENTIGVVPTVSFL